MGTQDVQRDEDAAELRLFISHLLRDVQALERMLDGGMIESGVHRIGVEQELFLVDAARRPAMLAMELLEAVADSHYTTELGLFNLEINLDPLAFGGDCLSRLESQLESALARLRAVAHERGAEVVLVGILPTLRKSDLGDGAHDPQATVSGAQRGAHPTPRRRLRVPAQGRRRVEHPA